MAGRARGRVARDGPEHVREPVGGRDDAGRAHEAPRTARRHHRVRHPRSGAFTSSTRRPASRSTAPGRWPSPRDRRFARRPVRILAIDQGTTGTTCLVVDEALRPVGRGYRELAQHFPQPGWVEHDPDEIWASVESSAAEALADAGIGARDLSAIGITNQRETTLVWERRSGRPVHRAIVWQDRRTAARCPRAPGRPAPGSGRASSPTRTSRRRSSNGSSRRTELPQSRLAFGTVDTWLVWKLTGGASHVTDVTNASRTMLLDLATGRWDDELLDLFAVERSVLPSVVGSSGIVAEGVAPGRARPGCGRCRRPAGRALRPGLLRARRREGDLRDGNIRARQSRPAHDSAVERRPGDSGRGRARSAELSSPPRGPCSSAAPRCSGCATGSE